MAALCAIGLMSGTSMDGIDIAFVKTDGENHIEAGPSMFVPYEAAFRLRIEEALETAKAIVKREDRSGGLAELEREISLRHAVAVEAFLKSEAGDWGKPDIIGFHGQTVLHRPAAGVTVQLGDGALLARETGIPVVCDMRANDMAHGGQGAPLVPAYHAALARSLPNPFAGKFPVVFVNIGGISNVTFVPAQGAPVAFDTGPGNTLIDQWVSREGGVPFDAGGAIASEGGVVSTVVDCYLENPFFEKSGPKSLDRNDFTLDLARGLELSDGARTLAAVSAEAILKSAEHMPEKPKLWIVCGGGRKNPHIVGDLKAGAEKVGARVIVAEDAGLDGDATEAEAWAYLAMRSLKGLPLTFPTTTGCREPVSGGVLAKP
ncbi:anhydro-N-acetylmuramic acid kinase [Allomesorhizobium camelthorni]|uniref:Anhydro-N-acetylmuramic acid kinase n=1 Tax=Allomesorhizobium camelthorni TaxID=475069 RepID=A0A6G4W9S7_9HYPH|nr:anhydro-N-acetylmuramic acid kinase [Mesorhizobium camelthorni]NGO50973.1 anhydro-N-acetylmuramic acid kinase [Mesorhizobium camelthorni]